MVELRTGAQNEMEDKVTSLKDVLGKVTKDLRTFEIKLADIEQQQHKLAKQQETCKQAFDDHSTKLYATDKELVKLTTNQETYQKTVDDHTTKIISTEQALDNLRTTHETSRIQTKQDIDEVKGTQEVYQRQTNEKLDELTNTNALNCVPVDEGKKTILVCMTKCQVSSQRRGGQSQLIHNNAVLTSLCICEKSPEIISER